MRVATLARKLKLKPSELEAFLVEQQVPLERGSNTKLDDAAVQIVEEEFGIVEPDQVPVTSEVESPIESPEDEEGFDSYPEKDQMKAYEKPDEPTDDTATDEDEPDEVEVIKAPRIQLPGLKVKGKIELPEEPKKAEKREAKPRHTDRPPGKPRESKKRKGFSKDYNPLEAERRRQARQDEKRRKREAQQRKEARKRRYEQQFQAKAPGLTSDKEVPQAATKTTETSPSPKRNFLQRFWHWMNT